MEAEKMTMTNSNPTKQPIRAMRSLTLLIITAVSLAACQAGGYDPDRSRRILQGDVSDYYYRDRRDPTANDPDFTYGWDIEGD